MAGILHTSYLEIRKRPISETMRWYAHAEFVGGILHGLRRKKKG